jgi:transcriptional regulator with XRE-family HTH domain
LGIAGDKLRTARLAAGLTQVELAELAETSQSAIAAYENGSREPTLPVLERMVRAAGQVLEVTVVPDVAVFSLADLAAAIANTPDDSTRLRLVFEFLRGVDDDGHPLRLLVAREPQLVRDVRFDALLAAVAEDLCVRAGIRPPAWVHRDDRFLDGLWWVADVPSGRSDALVHAPASYRRRGVMIGRRDLEAA